MNIIKRGESIYRCIKCGGLALEFQLECDDCDRKFLLKQKSLMNRRPSMDYSNSKRHKYNIERHKDKKNNKTAIDNIID